MNHLVQKTSEIKIVKNNDQNKELKNTIKTKMEEVENKLKTVHELMDQYQSLI